MSTRNNIGVDVAIVGGGVTGLWLLNLLRARGYNCVLIERSAFGDGQTIASQGIIHGGLKYALGGALTTASEALAAMPGRWRDCLQGVGDVDLRGVKVLSDRHYLWANSSTLGHLGSFFASKMLRGRVRRLPQAEWMPPFDAPGFAGVVYELNDPVIDTRSLLAKLAFAQWPYVLRCNVGSQQMLTNADGVLAGVRVDGIDVSAQRYVLAAGAGNQHLLDTLRVTGVSMQRRPLHQVIVRGPGLVPLYAHCINGLGAETRLTITTHTDADGRLLWYLGGQLASEGVRRNSADLILHARTELANCLPWLDLADIDLETTWVERAEPQRHGALRPDGALVARAAANLFVCWPTKLALVPDLADQVLAALDVTPSQSTVSLPAPSQLTVAVAPWDCR